MLRKFSQFLTVTKPAWEWEQCSLEPQHTQGAIPTVNSSLPQAAETKVYHVLLNSSQYFSFLCFLISWSPHLFPPWLWNCSGFRRLWFGFQATVTTLQEMSVIINASRTPVRMSFLAFISDFQKWSSVSGEILVSLSEKRTPRLYITVVKSKLHYYGFETAKEISSWSPHKSAVNTFVWFPLLVVWSLSLVLKLGRISSVLVHLFLHQKITNTCTKDNANAKVSL